MAPDLAPEWATAPNGTYRLIIEGQPHMQCDLRLGTEDTPESANANAMEATAMRVVNAIPYVVEAAPGPDGTPRPSHIKERVRALGPTVRPDLTLKPDDPQAIEQVI